MDTTALRTAYDQLIEVALDPDLGEAADGGWDADHVLAHILSVDSATAAVALAVVSGSRPTFDNRVSLDVWNLDRIIAEHSGRADLIEHVQAKGVLLCDIADQLSEAAAAVLVPTLLLSNDEVAVDQPLPLAGLIGGLASNHLPEHAQQLRELRVAVSTQS